MSELQVRKHVEKVILLVEDNPDDQALTRLALANNHILNEVVVVQDGVEALDYLFGRGAYIGRDTRVLPSIVLLDLKLPKVDGLEVLRELRGDERTKAMPIIVLTSSKEEQDLVTSYSLGANSFIRKPVDIAQFQEAARQLGLYWLVLSDTPPAQAR